MLEREGLWDVALQQPLAPFKVDGRGTISLAKRDRDADDDLARIWKEVDCAHREAKKCSDKVMFHDGEGLQVPTPAYQHRHTASPHARASAVAAPSLVVTAPRPSRHRRCSAR